MKKVRDTKALLFENMAKLNSNFKLTEDKNWIQGAVNPEHKGYCTPMSKPTCTPRRKALAKRFKKGIEDEGVNFNAMFPMSDYKKKASEIKAVIDKLVFDEEDEALDTLYKLLVRRTKPLNAASQQKLTEFFDKFENYAS